MIIKREYVPFCVLFNSDKEAQKIFEKAFEESYLDEDRERIMEILMPQCLYQKDMGWCFNKLADVVEGFERLDNTQVFYMKNAVATFSAFGKESEVVEF